MDGHELTFGDTTEYHGQFVVLERVDFVPDDDFDIRHLHFRTMDDHFTLTVEGASLPLALSIPLGKRVYLRYITLYSGIAEGWNFDHIDSFVVCERMYGPCPERTTRQPEGR